MSVIMTFRVTGDPAQVEQVASREAATLRSIADAAKQNGLIAHRFYGSDNNEIMVVDEWPDPQSCRSFFESQREQIDSIMRESGVESEPEVTFWHKLQSGDEVGWGA